MIPSSLIEISPHVCYSPTFALPQAVLPWTATPATGTAAAAAVDWVAAARVVAVVGHHPPICWKPTPGDDALAIC